MTGLVFAEVEVDSIERRILFPTWLGETAEVTDFISNLDLAMITTKMKKSGYELGKGTPYPNEFIDSLRQTAHRQIALFG
ncbi:MAG: hypothetical protein AAB451_02080 [Patescibacteria group bacterium]